MNQILLKSCTFQIAMILKCRRNFTLDKFSLKPQRNPRNRSSVLFIGSTVTKNQLLRTKCQPKFFLSFHFEKRREQLGIFFFQIEATKKTFGWHIMVFRIWFLVTIRSNEMNKRLNSYEEDIDMFLIRKKENPNNCIQKSQVTFYRK